MLILCLAALFFPASVCGCVRGERGHPQSPGPPTGSKVSTGTHFFVVFNARPHLGLYNRTLTK